MSPLRNLDFRRNLPDISCRLRVVRIGRFFSILPIFREYRTNKPRNATLHEFSVDPPTLGKDDQFRLFKM